MNLFDPISVGTRSARNRFFSQPMEANDAAGGKPGERTITRYRELALGGWGIVCVESTAVTRGAVAAPNGLYLTEETAQAFESLAGAVHRARRETLLFLQLSHSGAKSMDAQERRASAGEPSILAVQERFLSAARLALEVGFDGIDFKLCHGYFTAELLRPRNRVENGWGGGWPERSRFALTTFARLRSLADQFGAVLGSRVTVYEPISGGMGTAGPESTVQDLHESLDLLTQLRQLGADFVDVTLGDPAVTPALSIPGIPDKAMTKEHRHYTALVSAFLEGLPVVGSAYSALGKEAIPIAEQELAAGHLNLVGFGRACLADPWLPEHLAREEQVRWCTACNRCGAILERGGASYCPVYNNKETLTPS
jgi:2,4-dienoyl-CoA reductase-like NADH-dependent reductase (Old Yellow Enzyme family)